MGVEVAGATRPEPWGRALVVRALRTTWWVWLLPAALGAALLLRSVMLLDYVHVLAAILWTGADLLLGFVVGPVLRRVDPATRLRFQREMMPRTLLYFPVMAGTTTTAGWYLATSLGFMRAASPLFGWLVAALAVVTVLTVQGLGVLLPTNVRVYAEMLKPEPDLDRVRNLTARYVRLVGFQGCLQVGIVLIMVHLVMG